MAETVFQRRDFLKLVGLGAIGAAGCAQPADKLIPYLVPPRDILPGVGYWYASTCRECATGCGILVKARDGRAIKIEGNPNHPVNRGALCARGHAALQGLYDPDRLRAPMVREGQSWKAITWDEALALAAGRLRDARTAGGVALLTANATGSFEQLAREFASASGGAHLVYEPFSPHAMIEANRRTLGVGAVPHYDFERANAVVSFGADFLETWLNPMGNARGFAAMRARPETWFVAVEPRLSLTGANADEWIAVKPGGEAALALAMVHVIVSEGLGSGAGAADAVRDYAPETVATAIDVPADAIRRIARRFAAARPGLAVPGGVANQSEHAVALHAAVNLLNHVTGNLGQTVRFGGAPNVEAVSPMRDVQQLVTRMSDGGLGALIVHEANPVYAAPAWTGFAAAMDKVPFKLSLSSVMDETTARCDLVLPSLHALESLGDAEPARGVLSIVQPTMQKLPMFDARPAGDTLIALASAAGFGTLGTTWTDYVKARWRGQAGGQSFDAFWDGALARGGVWSDAAPGGGGGAWSGGTAFATPELAGNGDFALVVYPTVNFHDGRGANKGWLQELPDPVTKTVWGSWVELHPDTAKRLGVDNGNAVVVETDSGKVTLPVYVYAGIRPDTIAIPLGQGHTEYGRYAKNRGVNPLALLAPVQDAASGEVAYLSTKARVSKAPGSLDLVRTQRHMSIERREIAEIIPVSALLAGGAAAAHGAADAHAVTPGGAGAGHGGGADTTHANGGVAHTDTAHGAAAGAAAGHAAAGAGHGAEAGGGHHVSPNSKMLHPMQTRPGQHTEPRANPGEIPAHARSAYEPEHVVRGPRQIPVADGGYGLAKHRWAMAIDLNSCTGCSACVTACYAENNIPIVGPFHVQRGREMAWLRIERFEERIGPNGVNDVRFLPMLCQHCSDAPCETVCPVYATYHTPEGLNAQVYNRCVGTRYCSNNCPYKVRAFNFMEYAAPEKDTFAFPEPLNWQLNPDVTVRNKGVMEKCTFCVQRILEAKGKAKDEGRSPRDGEFTTACAQSCPSRAIVFGDLMDENSEVSRLSHDGRRYWVLSELQTRPGVTYLKKIQRDLGAGTEGA